MDTEQMSHPKSTPGPWQRNGSHIYGPDPERILVCQVLNSGGPEQSDRFDGDSVLILWAPRLRAALQGLMDMVSNGSLVRPVDRDAEAGWAMKQLPLVMALKAADDALDATINR